ncbi:rRNA maturation RNase YbeY [Tepidamorphus sp. 3E244]|uniref:rRNA maturation RNase YbeY n=1 Tax=Tepidamorphus sp. 3E244 TaxID=3385498 RepID=UPI0038FC9822
MTGQTGLTVDVVMEGGDWDGLLSDDDISAAAAAVANRLECSGELALALGDDAMLRKLNADFRGKDEPTNVLSFPSGEEGFLGDIAISAETLAREAAEQAKQPRHHAVHLLVHGILHLLDYDHDTNERAEEMEALERLILENLGIADPYADEPLAVEAGHDAT